jgi:hypothetical protein
VTGCIAFYTAPKTPEKDEQIYFCRIRQRRESWWTMEVLKVPLNHEQAELTQTAESLEGAKKEAGEMLLLRLRADGRDPSGVLLLNWRCE